MKVYLSNYACAAAGIGPLPGIEIKQGIFGDHPGRLAEFDLCVFDYSDGFDKGKYKTQFDKQILEALEKGSAICFVHENEQTPGGYMSDRYFHPENVEACIHQLPGFQWHHQHNFRISTQKAPHLSGQCLRNEFQTFFDKWGVSHTSFGSFKNQEFEDVLLKNGAEVLAFVQSHRKGLLFYLPFQRHGLPNDQATQATCLLVQGLSSYINKRAHRLPTWATAPIFSDEEKLQRNIAALQLKLDEERKALNSFDRAKALAIAGEHTLEIQLPMFIEEEIGVKTRRNEQFIEDFWILNPEGNDIAICEVKSVSKGFKKGFIYDAYNHREKRGLDETFPAVLFVNTNLQATSWKEKDVCIPAAERKIAFENHVLILRMEDLVRLWDMVRLKKIDSNKVRELLTSNRGWCSVSEKHEISILNS